MFVNTMLSDEDFNCMLDAIENPKPPTKDLVELFNKFYNIKAPEEMAEIVTPVGSYQTTKTISLAFDDFITETAKEYTGAIGGQYTYSFTATSLGTILEIKDGITGKIFNATDYASW